MNHPRILIDKPYVSALNVDEEREMASIRLDLETNLPFWFEVNFDLRTNQVVGVTGRTGQQRAKFAVHAERRPDGVHFSCHDSVNDWNVEFQMVGI